MLNAARYPSVAGFVSFVIEFHVECRLLGGPEHPITKIIAQRTKNSVGQLGSIGVDLAKRHEIYS